MIGIVIVMALFIFQLLDHVPDNILVEFVDARSLVLRLKARLVHTSPMSSEPTRLSTMELLVLFLEGHPLMVWERVRHHAWWRSLPKEWSTLGEGLASKVPLSDWHHSWMLVLRVDWHWTHAIETTMVLLLFSEWMSLSATVLPMVV